MLLSIKLYYRRGLVPAMLRNTLCSITAAAAAEHQAAQLRAALHAIMLQLQADLARAIIDSIDAHFMIVRRAAAAGRTW